MNKEERKQYIKKDLNTMYPRLCSECDVLNKKDYKYIESVTTTKRWKERVRKNEYTHSEWNNYNLCRYVDYSWVPLNQVKHES